MNSLYDHIEIAKLFGMNDKFNFILWHIHKEIAQFVGLSPEKAVLDLG